MGKYSRQAKDDVKSVKARGSNLRVHFKNTYETAMALKGLKLKAAQKYLQNVKEHKDVIPFRVHTGGIGHHAQAKKHKHPNGRWPQKSCQFLLDLLLNAESNAESQGLEPESLYIYHIQVNQAPKMRRRTYRAHGRIGPYQCSPCHIEMILSQQEESVAKPAEAPKRKRRQRLGQGATAPAITAAAPAADE
eukprot:gb/GEZN01017357.1/.p2 GENE.gb/GEZN01017357.1/~~gb/GEZN01017357.1/.p2  ORF type:complete len:191 (-),score=39.13 gb/GEZN01017357.1/:58-630(-)